MSARTTLCVVRSVLHLSYPKHPELAAMPKMNPTQQPRLHPSSPSWVGRTVKVWSLPSRRLLSVRQAPSHRHRGEHKPVDRSLRGPGVSQESVGDRSHRVVCSGPDGTYQFVSTTPKLAGSIQRRWIGMLATASPPDQARVPATETVRALPTDFAHS